MTRPLTGYAQQPAKIRRIFLYTTSPRTREWFTAGMRDLGWIDGRNISVEAREGQEIDEEALRLELRDRNPPVEVLVLGGALRIRAAMKVTKTVPIVGIDLESDPVASGFIKSLARPGANVSGVWMDLPELAGKQLQLLREAMPRVGRVALLWDDRFGGPQLSYAQAAAQASNLTLFSAAIHDAAEVDNAIERLFAQRPDALLVLTSPTVFTSLARIAEVARERRLPSICLFSTYADVAGLLSYGPQFPSMYRQLASYVHRILKGAKVGDLPIERPSTFELAINLKTANAIGLKIPQSLLLRANRLIE